jgi:AcrR family transcriptional regulator
MSDVSQRLGGSKATLYNYWSSKEELFAAALEEALKARTDDHYKRVSREAGLQVRIPMMPPVYSGIMPPIIPG